MKLVLKIEPYVGDDSSLDTAFVYPVKGSVEKIVVNNRPMYVIASVEEGRGEIIDYGYRTRLEAEQAAGLA